MFSEAYPLSSEKRGARRWVFGSHPQDSPLDAPQDPAASAGGVVVFGGFPWNPGLALGTFGNHS